MEIIYDMAFTQPFSRTATNGGGESAIELLHGLAERDVNLVACFDSNRVVTDYLREICNRKNITVVEYNGLTGLENLINSSNADVVVFPVCAPNYSRMHLNRTTKVISIIHDLSTIYSDYVRNDERKIGLDLNGKLKFWIKTHVLGPEIQRRHFDEHIKLFHITDNQKIITVSDYSKFAMCWYFGADLQSRINVCYSSNINQTIDEKGLTDLMTQNHIESNRFFLLVSGSRWHKNNCFAIRTLDKMFDKGLIDPSFKVVMTGTDQTHRKYYAKNVICRNQFVFLDFLDIHVLEGLYREEYALVYPSLYEGLGFPAVYSMKYGNNVLATAWTSLPEVCKEAAFYFDPTREESLAVAVMKCLSEPKDSKMIRQRYDEVWRRQINDKKRIVDEIVESGLQSLA